MNALHTLLAPHFSPEETELAVSLHRLVALRKGEFFFSEGNVCRNTAFLLSGLVRYFAYDKEGNDPTCYFSHPPHYLLDPYTFEEQRPSSINCQAVSNSTLAVLSFDDDRRLRAQMPQWADFTRNQILQVAMEFSNQKTMLALSASERYDFFLAHFPEVAKEAPLQFVASYLGITQPSLSRIRRVAMAR